MKLQDEHHEEEGGHSNIGRMVLEKYAVTESLQKKATFAAKQVLEDQASFVERITRDGPTAKVIFGNAESRLASI